MAANPRPLRERLCARFYDSRLTTRERVTASYSTCNHSTGKSTSNTTLIRKGAPPFLEILLPTPIAPDKTLDKAGR